MFINMYLNNSIFLMLIFVFVIFFVCLESSLCEFEKRLSLLNDCESIDHWERQTIAIVKRYAKEKRQQLKSPWPVLTIT